MSDQGQPVIVGAGPVGLGAALFLTRQGRVARVVEMRDEHRQAHGVGGQAGQFLLGQRLLEFILDGMQPTDACQRFGDGAGGAIPRGVEVPACVLPAAGADDARSVAPLVDDLPKKGGVG